MWVKDKLSLDILFDNVSISGFPRIALGHQESRLGNNVRREVLNLSAKLSSFIIFMTTCAIEWGQIIDVIDLSGVTSLVEFDNHELDKAGLVKLSEGRRHY